MRTLITLSIMTLVLFLSTPKVLATPTSASTESTQNSTSPYLVLKGTGKNLFSRISANQEAIKKFPYLMRDIVEEELMPSIDYRYASYRILGKHLKKISKKQRADFVQAMRHYLVRTYSVALAKYKNQEVIFESDKPTGNKRIIGVKTQIVEQGAPTINMVFQMRKNKKTGEWKAFDMIVEGISLLSSKQAELNKKIAREGIDHVTVELAALAK